MSKLNGKGPENKGSGTGRKLGKCNNLSENEKALKMGTGMGKRRKAGLYDNYKH